MNNELTTEIMTKYVSGGGLLSTRDLNDLGLNAKKINELIASDFIIRIKKGYYDLKDYSSLFDYSKDLYNKKEYEKAALTLKEYLKQQDDINAHLLLFLINIKLKNYEEVFRIFDILVSKSYDKYYRNIFIYLLSFITEIPDKYRSLVINLSKNDFLYENSESKENKLIDNILTRRFVAALKITYLEITNKNKIALKSLILKALLNETIEIEKSNLQRCLEFVKNKDYEGLITFLTKKAEYIKSLEPEKYTIKLAEIFLDIKRTKVIPTPKPCYKSVFSAIDNNDFALALELNIDYNQKHKINSRNSPLYILLVEINELIKEIRDNSQNELIVEEPIKAPEENFANTNIAEPTSKDQREALNWSINAATIFTNIISSLMQKDTETAFTSLKDYLNIIKKSEYEFLIANLIKISLAEKDFGFKKPMLALTLISNGTYTFDIAGFIKEFYVALSSKNYDIARINLDIIKGANKLGEECPLLDNLYQILEISVKEEQVKTEEPIISAPPSSRDKKVIEEQVNVPVAINEPVKEDKRIVTKAIEPSTNPITNVSLEEKYADLIATKHEELSENNVIIILNPMSKEERAIIHKLVEKYPDMKSFSIGEEPDRCIVLRYFKFENINIKEYFSTIKNAFKTENYSGCIKLLSYLIQTLKEPKSFIYAKLGFAYLKTNYIKRAINCFTIATFLNKEERSKGTVNTTYDFTTLIEKLKGNNKTRKNNTIDDTDYKPYVKISIEEFNYEDVNDYYGIDKFPMLNHFILSSGYDIESACQKFGLNDEETNIVKLIYAKIYYSQKDEDLGDLFLKDVEKSPNKTSKIKNIIKEIRTNKKFYPYRGNVENEQLRILQLRKK